MRQGSYRIVYEIQDDILKVIVVKIGQRRDDYSRNR
jgi:mRNA-degrading endonuclease RelE of RelBE toxin-antitoxin system